MLNILTMANAKYRPYADVLVRQAGMFGYRIVVADVENEAFFVQGGDSYVGKSPCKPRIIRKHLNGSPLVYMDADAFLKAPIHDAFDLEFDVAVTIHPPERRRPNHTYANAVGWLNAGVIFFRPSGKGFIDVWENQPSLYNSDQERLTLTLKGRTDWEIGTVVNVEGFRIRLLDGNIYNYNFNWGADKCRPLPETKVVHYVGQWRSRFPF